MAISPITEADAAAVDQSSDGSKSIALPEKHHDSQGLNTYLVPDALDHIIESPNRIGTATVLKFANSYVKEQLHIQQQLISNLNTSNQKNIDLNEAHTELRVKYLSMLGARKAKKRFTPIVEFSKWGGLALLGIAFDQFRSGANISLWAPIGIIGFASATLGFVLGRDGKDEE